MLYLRANNGNVAPFPGKSTWVRSAMRGATRSTIRIDRMECPPVDSRPAPAFLGARARSLLVQRDDVLDQRPALGGSERKRGHERAWLDGGRVLQPAVEECRVVDLGLRREVRELGLSSFLVDRVASTAQVVREQLRAVGRIGRGNRPFRSQQVLHYRVHLLRGLPDRLWHDRPLLDLLRIGQPRVEPRGVALIGDLSELRTGPVGGTPDAVT